MQHFDFITDLLNDYNNDDNILYCMKVLKQIVQLNVTIYNLFTLWPSIHSHTPPTQSRNSLTFIHTLIHIQNLETLTFIHTPTHIHNHTVLKFN